MIGFNMKLIEDAVKTIQRLTEEVEKMNHWLAILNGYPSTTDPRKLPHAKTKVKYDDVIHPHGIPELIRTMSEITKKKG